jgi:organic hydroperoxide reductase OsmC/OhrA
MPSPDTSEFTLELKWESKLSFTVKWDLPDAPELLTDEPPALGGSGKGPNPSRMIVAGVANCLASSLMFCLQKVRADVKDMRIRAHGTVTRNPEGRLRLTRIRVEPLVSMPAEEQVRLARCVGMFEDFCIVTEAVRNGVPIDVQVLLVDENGKEAPMEARVRKDGQA